MKLHRSLVAVTAVAALTLAVPTAAHAGSSSKGKATSTQAAKHKAAAAAKKEAGRKKAEQARSRFTFPGKVVTAGATELVVTRKVRGVTEQRTFVLDPAAVVKRDGARIALSAVQPGDHVVVQGRKVNGVLTAFKINVESAVVTAPEAPATPTVGIVI